MKVNLIANIFMINIYVDKIIHQRLLFKEAQLKKFLNKYMDFLVNFEKLEVDDM